MAPLETLSTSPAKSGIWLWLHTRAIASKWATEVLSEVMLMACTLPPRDLAASSTSAALVAVASISSNPSDLAASRMVCTCDTELASAGL